MERKQVKRYKKAGRLPDGFRWFKPVMVSAPPTPALSKAIEAPRDCPPSTPFQYQPSCKVEEPPADTKSMQFPTPGPNHPSCTAIVPVPAIKQKKSSKKRRKRKGGKKDKTRKRRRLIRTVRTGPRAFPSFPAARLPKVFTGNNPKDAVELAVQFLVTLCTNQKQAASNVYGTKYPALMSGIETVLDQLTERILDPNQTLVEEGDLKVVMAPTYPNPENVMNKRALQLLIKQNEELDSEIQEFEELRRTVADGSLFEELGLKPAPQAEAAPPGEEGAGEGARSAADERGLATKEMNRQLDEILTDQLERLSRIKLIDAKVTEATRMQHKLAEFVARTSSDFRGDSANTSHRIVGDFVAAKRRAIEQRESDARERQA